MTFAWPHLLFLLVVPIVLLVWELRRRQQQRTTFHPKILQAEAGQSHLRLQSTGAGTGSKPRWWLALGLVFAILALARPQWGHLQEPVFDQSREIVIAIDLSRSMLSQDVKPSRLARAKLLVDGLLEKLKGERVGLAVFSGTAFLQSPLSSDYEILREFLPSLNPNYLPEGGTNYRALIETALRAFGDANTADRFLIVLSDGEATDDDWQSLVPDLKKRHIRAICLGIGTTAGAMIPDGSGAFVKDERGAVVLSKLESKTLQKLAQETDGVYRNASSWVDLAGVLQQTVDAGRKGQFVEKRNIRLVERYQWALAPALLCLLLSFWLELPVRPRPRALKLSSGPGPAALGLVALLGFFAFAGLPSLRAAATEAPADTKPKLSPLGQIVSRLSAEDRPSGRDWAELARETVTWGQKLQTAQQPVPEGPVRDALEAVNRGSKLDPKTADWPQLREELEALLQKPKPPEQKPPPQDQKQDQKQQDKNKQSEQNQPPKSQDQQKQDQSQQNQQKQQDQSGQQSQPNQPSDQQKQQQSEKQQGSSQSGKSAFGDMKQKAQPPPPQGDMQQVGGTPKDKHQSAAQADPALAMPLQKLQQIRNDDSPGQLFQLMEGKTAPDKPKSGKNW